MRVEQVADFEDERLVDYRGVRDPIRLRDRDCFLCEGRQVLQVLLASTRFRPRSLLITPTTRSWIEATQLEIPPELPVYVVEPALLKQGTGYHFHQGCLAAVERPAPTSCDELFAGAVKSGAPLVMLETVSNPDNVGAIFRTAAAFGCPGVLLDAGSASPLYRKAVRTSMGAALELPFHHGGAMADHIGAAQVSGLRVLALTPGPEVVSLEDERARTGPRAVLLGSEGRGLSALAASTSDARVRIPMRAGFDSLNVAAAAAVALYRLAAL